MQRKVALKVVILLLSGGKDSLLALQRLLADGYKVIAFCIGGKEGQEVEGAKKAVAEHGVAKLHILKLFWFPEKTYNFWLLIIRDLIMLFASIILAFAYRARFIATGVKKVDAEDERLTWIPRFKAFCLFVLSLIGIKALLPVWDEP